jgi:hypothetical protein
MIVCFRCTTDTRNHLDQLVSTGSYNDYAEVIAAAVRNLVLMEQEVGEKGAIVFGGPPAQAEVPAPAPQPAPREALAPAPPAVRPAPMGSGRAKATPKPARNGPAKKQKATAAPEAQPPHVPALFKLEGFPREAPAGLADLPADLWSHGQRIPIDRWVLGQHNRLLPAKANARALIRLFLESPKGLEIAGAASAVAAQAAVLGDYLRQIDAKFDISRDDALATAFPSAEEEAEKGRTRYANQFVVYQNTKGELSGLMVDLKLINVVPQHKERRIVPTCVAWELAAMPNPLLDADPEGPPNKFTPTERAFLTSHILRSVPVEAFAYRVILDAVQQGQTTPDQIDAAMKEYHSEDRASDLSQSFLASQRSGAVSRMSDLGLIERRREGVRVFYAATEDGLAFLRECATNQPR